MEGILELFAEFSEPDEFHQQAQLELFAWREKAYQREWHVQYRAHKKHDPKWAEVKRQQTRARLARFRARRKNDAAWQAKRLAYQREWNARRAA